MHYHNNKYLKALSILTVSLLISIVTFSHLAFAHKGHAGPMVTFIDTKDVLKGIFPDHPKIYLRKESLTPEMISKIKEELGVDVNIDAGIYSYYKAVDRKNGNVIGAVMINHMTYEHGEMILAIGISTKGNIIKAAILGINKKYVRDIKETVGVGFLKSLEGISIKKLITMANEAKDASIVEEMIFTHFRNMGIILTTFIGL